MRLKFISCEVLARQAYYVAAFSPHVIDIELVDKGLHDEPDELRAALQGRLDALPADKYDAVLLGYGLCSNATAGLVCQQAPMIIPRAHDCITLYLGSRQRYGQEFRDHPGTFWYAPDYVERGGNEGGSVTLGASGDDRSMAKAHEEYVAKYGRDNADYLMEVLGAWREHYDRAAYIDTEEIELPDYRAAVQAQAARWDWSFEELAGSLVIIRDLLEGRWDEDRFLTVEPGMTLVPSYDDRVMVLCEVCASEFDKH